MYIVIIFLVIFYLIYSASTYSKNKDMWEEKRIFDSSKKKYKESNNIHDALYFMSLDSFEKYSTKNERRVLIIQIAYKLVQEGTTEYEMNELRKILYDDLDNKIELNEKEHRIFLVNLYNRLDRDFKSSYSMERAGGKNKILMEDGYLNTAYIFNLVETFLERRKFLLEKGQASSLVSKIISIYCVLGKDKREISIQNGLLSPYSIMIVLFKLELNISPDVASELVDLGIKYFDNIYDDILKNNSLPKTKAQLAKLKTKKTIKFNNKPIYE